MIVTLVVTYLMYGREYQFEYPMPNPIICQIESAKVMMMRLRDPNIMRLGVACAIDRSGRYNNGQ